MIFLHFFGRIGERCHRGCEWSHAWNLDHIFIHVQRDQRHKPKSKILWSWNRYDPVKLSGICSLDFPSGGSRDFVQDITQGVWKPEHFTPISGTDTAWNLLVFSTFVHLAAGKAPILLHKSYCWWYIHKSPQDGCWKIFIFTGKKNHLETSGWSSFSYWNYQYINSLDTSRNSPVNSRKKWWVSIHHGRPIPLSPVASIKNSLHNPPFSLMILALNLHSSGTFQPGIVVTLW